MSGPTWVARVLATDEITVGQVCSSIDCTFEVWYSYTVEPVHAPGRRSLLLAGWKACPETGREDQLYSMRLERQHIPVVLTRTGRFSNTVIADCTPIEVERTN